MIHLEGARLAVSGPLTIATVATLEDEGAARVAEADRVVDLSGAGPVDSAALALLLSWTRAASGAGRKLSIVGAPPALLSLAALYDVDAILPLAR
ncbi:MAG: STAS domain-containing protein [Zoogloea sp.]|jgi:phospholipid transport system transporter-binding protein|uniref:STAS domain-containing protein n=1 Tax=Zoogloea sp. TaxID=49181 RepID=UPI002605B2BA|nr:STAS domain-containing protein [Zoogloea sp.]MDD3326514.1 STAS domain-containing protein [Zoogloea sp.]